MSVVFQRGFSLLELLLVIAILAALSGTVLVMMDDADVSMRQQITLQEMAALRSATQQFEHDTGRLLQTPRSPADLSELLTRPADIAAWNLNSRHGWRGPYLDKPIALAFVDMAADLQSNGTGDDDGKCQVSRADLVVDVQAMADSFQQSRTIRCNLGAPINGTRTFIAWSKTADGESNDSAALISGRPLLIFDSQQRQQARVVSSGANGRYEHGSGDDLVLCLYSNGC